VKVSKLVIAWTEKECKQNIRIYNENDRLRPEYATNLSVKWTYE